MLPSKNNYLNKQKKEKKEELCLRVLYLNILKMLPK